MQLVPITDAIGTEVRGVDVNSMSDTDFERMYQAWIETTILLIRGQGMSSEQQVALTRRFGELVSYTRPEFSRDVHPDVLVLSNIVKDGRPLGSAYSGRVWHTDGHYLERPPVGSLLYAVETPPTGGDTAFANMFAAYAALPEATKRQIEGRKVIISRLQSRPYNYPDRAPPTEKQRAEWVDVPQPMVLPHSESGRKALYVGGSVPWKVVDMDEMDSAPLVTFVQEFAVMPRFTYRHQWRPGDIIVWDNRSAMHRAYPYDQNAHHRHMHRTTFNQRAPGAAPAQAGVKS